MIPSNSCNVRGECCSTPSPTVSPTKNPTQRPTTASPTTPRPTPNPTTPRPTPQPTPPPTQSAAFTEMLAFARTISSSSSLEDSNSPQYKAVEWLAQDKVDNGSNWSGYELLQRYVLRVLYHATNGDNWTNNDADTTWFQSSSVCDWGSINALCRGNGQQVDFISLYNDNLQGTIPDELGQLTALTYLRSDSNRLTGTIPSQVGQLTALTYLTFADNQLNGAIPSDLGQLTALTSLVLAVNQLTGTIPSQLGKLTALTALYLWQNQLTGTIPSQFGQLTALTVLNLRSNRLTGTIPLVLTQLSNLNYLYIHNNNFTGQVPSGFCAAPFPDWRNTGNNALITDCISEVQCDCCDVCF